MIHRLVSDARKSMGNSKNYSSSSSDSSIYATFTAAGRGAAARGATGAESGSPIKSSPYLLFAAFAGAFVGGDLVLPDALCMVEVFDAGLAAPDKNPVIMTWAVALVFFMGLTYVSLSLSRLRAEQKATVRIGKQNNNNGMEWNRVER